MSMTVVKLDSVWLRIPQKTTNIYSSYIPLYICIIISIILLLLLYYIVLLYL